MAFFPKYAGIRCVARPAGDAPKAASLKKRPSQEDFKNFFQRMLHPFRGLPTKIMITGSTIIIRSMIEATVFLVLFASWPSIVAKHRRQASSPSIVAKHRRQALLRGGIIREPKVPLEAL